MRLTHCKGVPVLALLVVLGGCADAVSRTVAPPASKDVATDARSQGVSDERAALTDIARLIAQSMDNEPARQHLKRDMRAAPFREHKLDLTSYLASKDGRVLLDRMSDLGGGEQRVLATLSKIRPLEFYVPVAAQRETWTGKADVLVVSQLDESDPIVSFDERGQAVALDKKVPPSQPVLSIVPVETDFRAPMPAAASRNARDQNGEAIGTLELLRPRASNMVACDESCGGGGVTSSGTTIPPGLYLEFSRILDMKEPWFRGEPEIEVHIQGPSSTAAPSYGDDRSCSGQRAGDYRKVFDQNDAFWEGRVMLYSEAEVVSFTNQFKDGFHVMFWEDDNDTCTLKLDTNTLVGVLQSTASATGTVALKVLPTANWGLVAAAFIGTFFSSAGQWLLTNDDFLGVAVEQTAAGYAYPDNTHVIMDGSTLNGRATIIYHH